MKQTRKLLARILVVLLILGLMPAAALTALADTAAAVLVQPAYESYEVLGTGTDKIAAVSRSVYQHKTTGELLSGAEYFRQRNALWETPTPAVSPEEFLNSYEGRTEYFLVEAGPDGLKQVSETFKNLSVLSPGLFATMENGTVRVFNEQGQTVSTYALKQYSPEMDAHYRIGNNAYLYMVNSPLTWVEADEERKVTVYLDVATGQFLELESKSGAIPVPTGTEGVLLRGFNAGDYSNPQLQYRDWRTDEVVIPGPYIAMSTFRNGYAIVEDEEGTKVITPDGTVAFRADKDYFINDGFINEAGYIDCTWGGRYFDFTDFGVVNIRTGVAKKLVAVGAKNGGLCEYIPGVDEDFDYAYHRGPYYTKSNVYYGVDYSKMVTGEDGMLTNKTTTWVTDANGNLTKLGEYEIQAISDTGVVWVKDVDKKLGVLQLNAAPQIAVAVDGLAVQWTDVKPFIDSNSRTLVPLRAVAEALGLEVSWDGAERCASFTDGSRTITFPIDKSVAYTTEGDITLDTAAVIVNDRTFAPARVLAEYFGYTVDWDGATRTVIIK